MKNNRVTGVSILAVLFLGSLCPGDDWPQFRGPDRDGKSSETGLLKKWPDSGPTLLWEVSGLAFPSLLERLVELGFERHRGKKREVVGDLR